MLKIIQLRRFFVNNFFHSKQLIKKVPHQVNRLRVEPFCCFKHFSEAGSLFWFLLFLFPAEVCDFGGFFIWWNSVEFCGRLTLIVGRAVMLRRLWRFVNRLRSGLVRRRRCRMRRLTDCSAGVI